MKHTVVFLAVMLAGCSVSIWEAENAALVCKDRGGWLEINKGLFPYARCRDGSVMTNDDLAKVKNHVPGQ